MKKKNETNNLILIKNNGITKQEKPTLTLQRERLVDIIPQIQRLSETLCSWYLVGVVYFHIPVDQSSSLSLLYCLTLLCFQQQIPGTYQTLVLRTGK